jgi:uncharacterized protein YicC (UPF0701 family)
MELKQQQIEAMQTASEYIENVIAGVNSAVEKFQAGEESEGSNLVAALVDGLDWLFQVIVRTREIQEEPIETDEMNEKLKELIEAFENGDYILVGDLLEYEVLPILESWSEGIKLAIDSEL